MTDADPDSDPASDPDPAPDHAAAPASGLASRLEALVAFLPELEAPGFELGRWAGGETLANGSISMPYYELGARGRALVGAIGRAGWVRPFDWMAWLQTEDGRAMREDPARMARATPEDLSKILTAIVRSERFGDGNLEGAVKSGVFLRILRRAKVLLDRERERAARRS